MPGSPELGVTFLRFVTDGPSSDDEKAEHDSTWECFDRTALRGCGIHSIKAGDGYIQCRFVVKPQTMNLFSTLHGGCIATLIDVVSSAALVTLWGTPGVSVTMNIHYISPGLADTTLDVRARVIRAGKQMATMVVDIVDTRDDDRIISYGTHVKIYSKTDQPTLLDPVKGSGMPSRL